MRDQYLATRGITPETADRFGLVYDEERQAIAIPYLSALGGEPIAWRYRLIGDVQGHGSNRKYDTEQGSKLHLFNVEDTNCSPVYLTEGELDTIVLKQMGLDAVGVPGTNGFKDEWRWLFFEAEVRIVFDGDDPGRKAARKVASTLQSVVSEVFVIAMPDGHDINSLFLEDRAGLERLLGVAPE